MDTEDNSTRVALQVEPTGPQKGGAGQEKDLESAHTIDRGKLHLITHTVA